MSALVQKFFLLAIVVFLGACNNYDLLDKLENPGGKENFTDRLYIFVTSQMTQGDMLGLNAGSCGASGMGRADCVCQALAAQNGRRRSATSKYLAWLSTTGSSMQCRFAGAMGVSCPAAGNFIWYNTNNEIVFNSIESASTGLMGGTPGLPAAPKYTETGSAAPTMADNMWTGTNTGGAVAANTCGDWTSNQAGVQGRTGQSDTTGPAWTNSSDFGCDLVKRVYCVAVP